MAAVIPTFKNEVRHYAADSPETFDVYAGDFYAGEADVYASRAITRHRTRFTNESRYKDEDDIR